MSPFAITKTFGRKAKLLLSKLLLIEKPQSLFQVIGAGRTVKISLALRR